MPALLALVPLKDWFYGAIIAALLAFGIHYHSLEKQEHAAKVVAIAAQAQVKAVDKTAETTETQSEDIYKAVIIPAVGDVGVDCVRKHASSSPLPAASPVAGAPVGEQPADGTAGPSYDPSGAALTRAKAADAQIAYLQRRIHELETQMNNSP
jgi:hypothetical protein